MSKHKQILKHLHENKSITGIIAMDEYKLYRLSSAINRMRKKGYKIITKMVKNKNGETFAKYILKD